jgi:DNA-binding NarL/FixJ family response regulator
MYGNVAEAARNRHAREPESPLGFSLPLPPGAVAMIAGMSGSVLVVDDDPAFRRVARGLLATFGLAVAGEAETAAAALAAVTALRPDAVLLDIRLPDRDGVALARELTALPWHPRVVLTSSNADAATGREVRDCGAKAFVPKGELPNAALGELLAGG